MEQDMAYIYRVYREGSFSRAAEKLYMTQPALSIAVKRVEAELGSELFDRSRHPLELTEAGRAYIAAAERIRATEEDLRRQLEDLRSLGTGQLRIGGTQYINSCLLADVLTGFTGEYPGVRVDLTEKSASELAGALRAREVDLIFSCDPELAAEHRRRSAFYDHVLLALPPTAALTPEQERCALSAADILSGRHLGRDCPRASLGDFREQEFLLLGPGNNLHRRSLQMLSEAGVTPRVKLMLSQLATAYVMAENGLGAAFVCDRIVRSPASRLRFFRLDSPHATRLFYILFSDRSYQPYAVRAFAEYAVGRIRASDLAHGRDWGIP